MQRERRMQNIGFHVQDRNEHELHAYQQHRDIKAAVIATVILAWIWALADLSIRIFAARCACCQNQA